MKYYFKTNHALAFCFITLIYIINNCGQTNGQVLSDNTLPSRTNLKRIGKVIQVSGGTRSGINLFHSFSKFKVKSNHTVQFDVNDATNIFARITSGTPSIVSGDIIFPNKGNLFLLNPRGFTFSRNSGIVSSGSVFISNSSRINFGNRNDFIVNKNYAKGSLPQIEPSEFIFNNNNGNIQVNSIGHNLIGGLSPATGFPVDKGIRLSPNQTISIIGSNVYLNGGIITSNGEINIAAIQEGAINLSKNIDGRTKFNYSENNIGSPGIAVVKN